MQEDFRQLVRFARNAEISQTDVFEEKAFDVPYKGKDFHNDVYIRLFNAHRGDAQSLPQTRLNLCEKIQSSLAKNRAVALVGVYPEVVSLSESIIQSWDGKSIFYRPRKALTIEDLIALEKSNRGGLIVINGVRWLFKTANKKGR